MENDKWSMGNSFFYKWFMGCPDVFKNKVLYYVNCSIKELSCVMDLSDINSERRIEYGSKINLLKRLYNDGIFGDRKKTI